MSAYPRWTLFRACARRYAPRPSYGVPRAWMLALVGLSISILLTGNVHSCSAQPTHSARKDHAIPTSADARRAILDDLANRRISAVDAAARLSALDASARTDDFQPNLTDPLKPPAAFDAPHAQPHHEEFGPALAQFGQSLATLLGAALDEARWGLTVAATSMDQAARDLRTRQAQRRSHTDDIRIVH